MGLHHFSGAIIQAEDLEQASELHGLRSREPVTEIKRIAD